MEVNRTAYLDNACTSKAHPEVAAAAHATVEDFYRLPGSPTDFTVNSYDRYERGRAFIADTLRVPRNTVCFVESTSHGFGMIANALPLEKEDNVLICDLEFFSTVICWQRHQERVGFTIRPVTTHGGIVTAADFERVADSHTKVIVISAVQEINGYRVDMDAFSRLARKLGAYLVVDGIQEVGALNPHLDTRDVDVYCAGGHKWLRNPYGAGFLYINDRIVETLEPDFYSYFNCKCPPGGWGGYLSSPLRSPFDDLPMVKDASKFETGATLNYTGTLGLVRAFEVIQQMGMDNIEREVLNRARYLQEGLLRLGASISGSMGERTLSGIRTFNLPGGIAQEQALAALLTEREIYCSLRYVSRIGGIRTAPHYYTDYDEIDYLLETTKWFLEQ